MPVEQKKVVFRGGATAGHFDALAGGAAAALGAKMSR